MRHKQILAKIRAMKLVGIIVPTLLAICTTPILADDSNKASDPAAASKIEQLRVAHRLYDDKNYSAARKSIETFIGKNPLNYNGYYLLGLIDTKERNLLPEYDQFAYNQFLKALYLEPRNTECRAICNYVVGLTHGQLRRDKRCVVTPSFSDDSPQSLLSVGLNCFVCDDESDARDLFNFVIKFCPAAAASAHYNLAAMLERKGELVPALKEYNVALAACDDRDRLFAAGAVNRRDVDLLTRNLVLRTIQLVEYKIKKKNKTWMGIDPEKGANTNTRMTINRLSPTDWWADIRDAGVNRNQ